MTNIIIAKKGVVHIDKKVKFEKLRKRRIEVNLIQQELAEQTDINILIIKALETGRSDTTYENF